MFGFETLKRKGEQKENLQQDPLLSVFAADVQEVEKVIGITSEKIGADMSTEKGIMEWTNRFPKLRRSIHALLFAGMCLSEGLFAPKAEAEQLYQRSAPTIAAECVGKHVGAFAGMPARLRIVFEDLNTGRGELDTRYAAAREEVMKNAQDEHAAAQQLSALEARFNTELRELVTAAVYAAIAAGPGAILEFPSYKIRAFQEIAASMAAPAHERSSDFSRDIASIQENTTIKNPTE